MKKTTIGLAICGSFCTFSTILKMIEQLKEKYEIIPIFSFNTANEDNRFQTAKAFRDNVIQLTEKQPVNSLQQAEITVTSGIIDVMVVAPCTGNTLAKLAVAVTDTPVTMAVKAHLRNNKPVVIGISTNDALGLNLKNIGILMSSKNIYFVPFGQDNPTKKPNSMIADFELTEKTIEDALKGVQTQPVIIKEGE